MKVHLIRSQACAENNNLTEDHRTVDIDTGEGFLQLTYEYLRDSNGEFVASYVDGAWLWEEDNTLWSDIVLNV